MTSIPSYVCELDSLVTALFYSSFENPVNSNNYEVRISTVKSSWSISAHEKLQGIVPPKGFIILVTLSDNGEDIHTRHASYDRV